MSKGNIWVDQSVIDIWFLTLLHLILVNILVVQFQPHSRWGTFVILEAFLYMYKYVNYYLAIDTAMNQ